MSTSLVGTRMAREPFPYWKIVAIVGALDIATVLILHGFPVTSHMLESVATAWVCGGFVFCVAEAIRRRRAK
jgi:hypothetical protein